MIRSAARPDTHPGARPGAPSTRITALLAVLAAVMMLFSRPRRLR